MPGENGSKDLLLSSHEQRLQGLEETVAANVKETMACRAQVDLVLERQGNGFQRVDGLLSDLSRQLAAVAEKVGRQDADLSKIKAADAASTKRRHKAAGAAAALSLAALGGAATEATSVILSWLRHK